MIEGSQEFRLALKPRQPIRILRERLGQHLDCDVALQPRVAGTIDLAHSAGADGGENFVGTESSASRQRHATR
jgi:hypothetical protein